MMIIGITGSIASGKSTVARLIAKKKYPLFSADKVVTDLYKNNNFINLLVKKFKLDTKKKIKLESIIHPLVREKMKNFLKIQSKVVILEIPLLIENKLNKYFDKIIFVDSKKETRLKRYLKRNYDKKLFEILDKRQLPVVNKKKNVI